MTGSAGLGVTEIIATVLVTVALFVVFASIVGYAFTNITVGQTLIYIVLRKKKDEENLLERKDEDELEEEEEDFDFDEDLDTDLEEDEEEVEEDEELEEDSEEDVEDEEDEEEKE